MAKSIRISDDLYEMASTEAVLMHRSLAQQIEHWAAIGQAVEASGELPDIRSAAIAHMRARDHERVLPFVNSGEWRVTSVERRATNTERAPAG